MQEREEERSLIRMALDGLNAHAAPQDILSYKLFHAFLSMHLDIFTGVDFYRDRYNKKTPFEEIYYNNAFFNDFTKLDSRLADPGFKEDFWDRTFYPFALKLIQDYTKDGKHSELSSLL